MEARLMKEVHQSRPTLTAFSLVFSDNDKADLDDISLHVAASGQLVSASSANQRTLSSR